MISLILSGFLAGLSVGLFCLGTCLPIFIPLILQSKQDIKASFRIVLEFSAGRLLGYTFFGAVVGFLGATIESQLIHKFFNLPTLLLGLVMIFTSAGIIRWGVKGCRIVFSRVKVPIILGFLTGVNVCPPFLASLSYVFNLASVTRSVSYFLAFFLGTSVYIFPAGFLGFFSDDKLLQRLARIAGIFVGGFFVYKGIIALVGY